MLSYFFPPEEETGSLNFPQKLHFIWLGSVFEKESDRLNVLNWKKKNPHYAIYIYIDSCTFDHTDMETIEKLKNLIIWAKKNDIFLRDVGANPADEIKMLDLEDCSCLVKNCLNKEYYFTECAGQYPNYAAASDILRIEILYQIGGIYLDVGDIFPGKKPIGSLPSTIGFLFSWDDVIIGNDILVSVAQGKVIAELRNYIYESYQLFYSLKSFENLPIAKHRKTFLEIMGEYNPEESEHLYDYRNPLRTPESSFYRKSMCVFLAGPAAIQEFCESKEYQLTHLFPAQYYTRPLKHCSSWYNFEINKKTFLPWAKNVLIVLWSSTLPDESLIKKHLISFGYSEDDSSLPNSLSDVLNNLKKQKIPQEDQPIMDTLEEKIRKIEAFLSLLERLWDKYVVEEESNSSEDMLLYNPYLFFLNSVFSLAVINPFRSTIRHNAFLKNKENYLTLHTLFETPFENISREDYLQKLVDGCSFNHRISIFHNHIAALKSETLSSCEQDKIGNFAMSLSRILFNRNAFNFSAYFLKDHGRYLEDIKKIKSWLENISNKDEITPESVLAFIQREGLITDEVNPVYAVACKM